MSWLPESQDRSPLTWWKGRPIYLAAYFALAGAASMILTTILMATSATGFLNAFIFSFENFWQHFFVWTPVTHLLVNPPSLWFLFGCYILWRFGEDVEKFLGRRAFIRLAVMLALTGPVVLSFLGLMNLGMSWTGFQLFELGVFITFAALYPNAQISIIIATFPVWIMAAVVVGISTLIALASQNWISLGLLWAHVGVAYAFVRFEKGEWSLRKIPFLFKEVPTSPPRTPRTSTTEPKAKKGNRRASSSSVDDILDKISREGMQSLTPEERSVLDKASEEISKRRPS